jgi:hypothetical protein
MFNLFPIKTFKKNGKPQKENRSGDPHPEDRSGDPHRGKALAVYRPRKSAPGLFHKVFD